MDNQMNVSEQNNTEYHVPDEIYPKEDVIPDYNSANSTQRMEQPRLSSSTLGGFPEMLSRVDFGRFKPLIIVIGLVVAILIVYSILTWRSSKEEAKDLGSAQELKTSQVNSVPVRQSQIPAIPNAVQQQNMLAEKMNQNLNEVYKDTQQNNTQIKHLNDTLADQQATLNNLNKTLNDLSLAISGLSKNIDQIVVNTTKPIIKAKPKKKVLVKKIVYHVKSIVIGRAWLESDTGALTTVRVGDLLNGARVSAILPKQGMVLMSNGEVIQYGANDI